MRIRLLLLSAGIVATLGAPGWAADSEGTLALSAGAREFLWQEPILVRVRLEGTALGLPAAPGEVSGAALRFEIDPPVPGRKGAKPLPQEAQNASAGVKARDFDLLEWFQFPNQGGQWTVKAVVEAGGSRLTSAPLSIAVRKPGKDDPEFAATARLHHLPWSNYESNKFCGDTFDVVKNWPKSQLAPYCHYWNGRFLQNQKEYAQAIASFRTAATGYPGFALADDADRGIAECEQALAEGKKAGASK